MTMDLTSKAFLGLWKGRMLLLSGHWTERENKLDDLTTS